MSNRGYISSLPVGKQVLGCSAGLRPPFFYSPGTEVLAALAAAVFFRVWTPHPFPRTPLKTITKQSQNDPKTILK